MASRAAPLQYAEDFARRHPAAISALLLGPILLLLIFFFLVPLVQLFNSQYLRPATERPDPFAAAFAHQLRQHLPRHLLSPDRSNSILVGVCTTLATLAISYRSPSTSPA
jgi:ABC-type spermidine/putrescine transport system permease subunit I